MAETPPNMDEKSANNGDIIKHCTLAEVLTECIRQWSTVNFAETHAGAGKYDSRNQSDNHIERLRDKVTQSAFTDNMLGRPYLEMLKNWWSITGNDPYYPGSSLQAATLLRDMLEQQKASLILAEYNSETFQKLKQELINYRDQSDLMESGFQEKIPELTDRDNLVLLIDPFGYAFGDAGINKGDLSLQRLLELLTPCWKKQACIVGFWCSATHANGQTLKKLFSLTLQLHASHFGQSKYHRTAYRRYWFGNYSIEWIGIGKGAEVVNGLPTESWKSSWLGMDIKQSPLKFSVFAASSNLDGSLTFKDMQE